MGFQNNTVASVENKFMQHCSIIRNATIYHCIIFPVLEVCLSPLKHLPIQCSLIIKHHFCAYFCLPPLDTLKWCHCTSSGTWRLKSSLKFKTLILFIHFVQFDINPFHEKEELTVFCCKCSQGFYVCVRVYVRLSGAKEWMTFESQEHQR